MKKVISKDKKILNTHDLDMIADVPLKTKTWTITATIGFVILGILSFLL
jgi:hypothetical protein